MMLSIGDVPVAMAGFSNVSYALRQHSARILLGFDFVAGDFIAKDALGGPERPGRGNDVDGDYENRNLSVITDRIDLRPLFLGGI
ncbi:MAG: hypothetical protein V2A34_12530 [Lentisphaerota bacterium]